MDATSNNSNNNNNDNNTNNNNNNNVNAFANVVVNMNENSNEAMGGNGALGRKRRDWRGRKTMERGAKAYWTRRVSAKWHASLLPSKEPAEALLLRRLAR